MPLLFYIKALPVNERYAKVKEVSSITHGHFRSVLACFIYLEMALQILNGADAEEAYQQMKAIILPFAMQNNFNESELKLFNRILQFDIKSEKEAQIHSGGYVLQSLEASIWCVLNTDNYTDAVLKAVNLGGDTDTTACITGGMAGLLYGYDNILNVWVEQIARKSEIEDICEQLLKKITP